MSKKEAVRVGTPFRIRVFTGTSNTGDWQVLKYPAKKWQDEMVLYPNTEPETPYKDGDAVKITVITGVWSNNKQSKNGTWYKTICISCDIVRVSEHEAPPIMSEEDIDAMSLDDVLPF